MNARERLRRCYFNEELDRPGILHSRAGLPQDDPSYAKLGAYIEAHTDLKRSWGAQQFERPYSVDHHGEPYSEDFERQVTTLHTPTGDLQSSRLVSLKGQPGLHETYLIKTRKDAEKYLSLPLPELGGHISSFFAANREMGDRGIVSVGLGRNPGGFTAELLGSETFAFMSVEDRDLLHTLCARQMTVIMNRLKFLLAQNVGPYFAMSGEEYIAPPLHGPTDFRDFNVQYDKPIIDLIHDAGGRIHIHCHGRIKRVFQEFVHMGTDVLHPFEAPPMGDITAEEAKGLARGKMGLEGNIQIAAMYEYTPEQIRKETEALIKVAFDDYKGLIVCPTTSPYIRGKGEACFERYKTMIDTVLEWRKH